jgi:type VI secretion system protein ImpE
MLHEQLLREARPEESLAELQALIRKEPANARLRIFLFQLLAVLGQWERALNQLNVLNDLDAASLAMVQTYREVLQCEALRAQVFAGRRTPLFLGQPEAWVAPLLESLRLLNAGEYESAETLRQQAFDAAPTSAGSVNEQAFDWIADADPRLGPVVEMVVNGRYYWVPFNHIGSIRLDKPEDLRDQVWMPASFTWRNGGEAVGFIPTRYPGSEAASDGRLRLATMTDWQEHPGGLYLGVGQRILTTDAGDFPLMDCRVIQFTQIDG